MRLSSKSENKFATAAATRSASRAILSPTAEAPSHPKAAVNPIGTLRPHRRLYLQTTQKLLLDRAIRRNAKSLAQEFARVPYARYAPVRRQLLNILRSVNKARSKQRFDELLPHAIGLRRKIVKPFEQQST